MTHLFFFQNLVGRMSFEIPGDQRATQVSSAPFLRRRFGHHYFQVTRRQRKKRNRDRDRDRERAKNKVTDTFRQLWGKKKETEQKGCLAGIQRQDQRQRPKDVFDQHAFNQHCIQVGFQSQETDKIDEKDEMTKRGNPPPEIIR